MKQTVREIVREALPTKHEAKTFVIVAIVVVIAGIVSVFLAWKFNSKFANSLGYVSRECTALVHLSKLTVDYLRRHPDEKIRCPTSDDAISALFRTAIKAPAATMAGYYDVMLSFRDFLKDMFSTKCTDGYMTRGGLADAIETAVVARCAPILIP
jgi:hypothetical protein